MSKDVCKCFKQAVNFSDIPKANIDWKANFIQVAWFSGTIAVILIPILLSGYIANIFFPIVDYNIPIGGTILVFVGTGIAFVCFLIVFRAWDCYDNIGNENESD